MGVQASLCCGDSLSSVLSSNEEAQDIYTKLQNLLKSRPYLERKVHPLHPWVTKTVKSLSANKVPEAKDSLNRLQTAINIDDKRLRATFDKFDLDRSGGLDVPEFRHFVTYVGFGPECVDEILKDSDRDTDGVITLEEFETFVGRVGGMHMLFEQRRNRMADDGEAQGESLLVGQRVRAYCKDEETNEKSQTVFDARVLDLDKKLQDGSKGLSLEFGLGAGTFQQDVPRAYVEEDTALIESLNSIGIIEDAQHYWTILLPHSEQNAVKPLVECQSKAIYEVRQQATSNHDEVIGSLMERCEEMEPPISSGELLSMLTWVRDMAPILVHVDLDTVGPFLENDTHYRNQFETKSSMGLLDEGTREEWERDLFNSAYDSAQPFERPKYGVLDVMNDNRGIICARQYGDSYMTLQDVRLRCTFAPEDSGGIECDRLAVLDQYAHVLNEYDDDELREVNKVANAAEGTLERIGDSNQLAGYNYKEAQIHGEVDLKKHVKRLVAHPRHRVDGWDETRIRALCDKHGWEFMWMDEEKNRRMHEERGHAMDSKVLQMSWASQEMIKTGAGGGVGGGNALMNLIRGNNKR